MQVHTGREFKAKAEVRQFVWRLLEESCQGRFPFPLKGRIPNCAGSGQAAGRLLELASFRRARVVFCAPDYAIKAARDLVLEEDKTLAFAMPHMTAFLQMRGAGRKTSIKAMGKAGRPLESPIDLKVSGCVAVDLKGNRIGKGSGYGDQEVAKLRAWGLLPSGPFPFVTLCHPLQLFDDLSHLAEPHDVSVSAVCTAEGIIRIGEDGSASM
jgi:5-formyltetrahydrofolate cyclo-ligase